MTTSTALKQPPLGDEEIAEWLKANPEFFRRNGDLLAALRLPHSTGVAVSLIERQVEVLREKNQTAESRLAELVTIARSNEQLAAKIHQFARRLIRAPTRRAVLAQIERGFREEFDTGHTVLLLFKGNAESAADLRFVRHVSADDSNLNGFENLLATGRPRCGQIRDSQREFIFGPDSASIGSVALVPLAGADASAGLLVLGSVNRERFHPGMSTDFLQLLGELISDALARD
ncbi:MAG: DUF484 family protein [Proteobacteria bacterium]|jgi:uncharacterized protein|nr:DUF484 family protein [Pseudomonadota bacterium]MCC6631534.1 DUF484 family protein [Gammaproteobacteria bacterium]